MPAHYDIIDEPKERFAGKFVVNPILILFLALIGPAFLAGVVPTMYIRGAALVWVAVNGYLLGSPTLKREIMILVGGTAVIIAAFAGIDYALTSGIVTASQFRSAIPYIRLVLLGVYLFTVYLAIFMQMGPYEIWRYVREAQQRD